MVVDILVGVLYAGLAAGGLWVRAEARRLEREARDHVDMAFRLIQSGIADAQALATRVDDTRTLAGAGIFTLKARLDRADARRLALRARLVARYIEKPTGNKVTDQQAPVVNGRRQNG